MIYWNWGLITFNVLLASWNLRVALRASKVLQVRNRLTVKTPEEQAMQFVAEAGKAFGKEVFMKVIGK